MNELCEASWSNYDFNFAISILYIKSEPSILESDAQTNRVQWVLVMQPPSGWGM